MKFNIILLISVSALLSFSGFEIFKSLAENKAEAENEILLMSSDRLEGLNIGDIAPEMEYLSPDGKAIKLSSLRGKMVLIDFWASWCPPCRQENPNLVKSYEHYKNAGFQNGKGFTIYSVSLDKEKNGWLAAIKSDKLTWEYHVSDLKGWKSEAASLYEVEAIPSNFLIDGKGIIVAKNLRGAALDAKLSKLLK